MRGTGGDPVSGIFERLTPTVGVTFLRVGVTLGGGYLDGVGERVSDSWVRTWVGGGNEDEEAPKTSFTHLEYQRIMLSQQDLGMFSENLGEKTTESLELCF